MISGTRLLCLLLLACGLSSAPLGSMEVPDPGTTTVSVPHAGSARAANITVQAPSRGDRADDVPRHGGAPAAAGFPWRLPFVPPTATVAPAPPHGGFELVALLGFRATAPPRTS